MKMKLTDRQNAKLKEHAKHHSTSHINKMKKLMREGKSFTKSHNEVKAMEKKTKPKAQKKPMKSMSSPKAQKKPMKSMSSPKAQKKPMKSMSSY